MLTGVEFNNWQNTYTTVSYVSSNWDSVYSSFNSQSANNVSVYSTVQSNSATWGAGGGGGSFTVEDANAIIGLSIFL